MKNPFQFVIYVLTCLFLVATLSLYLWINYGRSPVTVEKGTIFVQSDESIAQYKVNINTADLQQLTTLPQIGPVLAQRIMDYREANGRFESIADLTSVAGIGETRLKMIMDYITAE